MLPHWWSEKARRDCERQALNAKQFSCLRYAVEKHDIVEHYNDDAIMPMKLRFLAEKIYGFSVQEDGSDSDEDSADDGSDRSTASDQN